MPHAVQPFVTDIAANEINLREKSLIWLMTSIIGRFFYSTFNDDQSVLLSSLGVDSYSLLPGALVGSHTFHTMMIDL